jgi:hypothetical protein
LSQRGPNWSSIRLLSISIQIHQGQQIAWEIHLSPLRRNQCKKVLGKGDAGIPEQEFWTLSPKTQAKSSYGRIGTRSRGVRGGQASIPSRLRVSARASLGFGLWRYRSNLFGPQDRKHVSYGDYCAVSSAAFGPAEGRLRRPEQCIHGLPVIRKNR